MKLFLYFAGIFALCVLLAAGCSRIPSADRAERTVESLGLNNAHVTGRRYAFGLLGGCKGDDLTLFHVVATAADGSVRHVDVCAPLIGGYTVRG